MRADEGNSSSRKTRQQVAHAQSLQWQAELAQAEEAMRLDGPPLGQGSPLQLVHQVEAPNWPGHRKDAHAQTLGKKGKERIQGGNHRCCFGQEEEQTGLSCSARLTATAADETTRMSTRRRELATDESRASSIARLRLLRAPFASTESTGTARCRAGAIAFTATAAWTAIDVVRICLSFSLSETIKYSLF